MLHAYQFKTHHPNRYVNSLYLDSPNLSRYEENPKAVLPNVEKLESVGMGELSNPRK